MDETVLCSHFHTNEGWEQIHRFLSFKLKSSWGNLDLLLYRKFCQKKSFWVEILKHTDHYTSPNSVKLIFKLVLLTHYNDRYVERGIRHMKSPAPLSPEDEGNSTLLDCCGWLSGIFYAYTMLALLPFQPWLKWCRTQKRCKSKGFFCQFWY